MSSVAVVQWPEIRQASYSLRLRHPAVMLSPIKHILLDKFGTCPEYSGKYPVWCWQLAVAVQQDTDKVKWQSEKSTE